MTKKQKPKRKAHKPGPKGERLIITGSPEKALSRLLKKNGKKHTDS